MSGRGFAPRMIP